MCGFANFKTNETTVHLYMEYVSKKSTHHGVNLRQNSSFAQNLSFFPDPIEKSVPGQQCPKKHVK